jgi:hypothetical protein
VEVIQTLDGKWVVTDANGNVLAMCETNAEAWRAYDRVAGEPRSRQEAVTDWSWNKWVSEGW